MSSADATPDLITAELIEVIGARVREGKRVRRHLPDGGRIHIDRPLPFICIHRKREGVDDDATASLVLGEGSYLIAPSGDAHEEPVLKLVQRVVTELAARFNAFLIVEIWAREAGSDGESENGFRVMMRNTPEWPTTVKTLATAIQSIDIPRLKGKADVCKRSEVAPPGMQPLLPQELADDLSCLIVGLEVPAVYRDTSTADLYPSMLRGLRRDLSRVLQKAFYEFITVQTNYRPLNYVSLGRQAVLQKVWEADTQLAAIDRSFDFLLAVTPVNSDAAWEEFRAVGFEKAPVFHYHHLTFDPDSFKRRLFNIDLDDLEDPALTYLFREKRVEMDRKLSMLSSRDSHGFFYDSLQLYGGVSTRLLRQARRILSMIDEDDEDAPDSDPAANGRINAEGFARRARDEIAWYRRRNEIVTAAVEIRRDIPSLMVSHGNLLVNRSLSLSPKRVDALIHHEVGTHVVTYFNGRAQPMKLLATGLPRYDELQEGLAVMAEFFVGGLTAARMRLLAARVVAVWMLEDEASFVDVFKALVRDYGLNPSSAFSITVRVFRGGGFTKDAVYLRGLVRLLDYLSSGPPLEPLFAGKISLKDVPVVQELLWRNVLKPPPLMPRYLDAPDAGTKLDWLKQGRAVHDLL